MTEQASLLGAGGPPSRPGKTNGALVEAIALYRSAGYAEVAPFNDEPYAQALVREGDRGCREPGRGGDVPHDGARRGRPAKERAVNATESPRAAAPRTSDRAVQAATGRAREAWLALLDGWGAAERSHRDTAAWLMSEHGVEGWWAQTLTVDYEHARGLRPPGGARDGTYAVNVSRTIAAPLERLYEAVIDPAQREGWLPGAPLRERAVQPGRSARFDWEDGATRVHVGFDARGEGRSQVSLAHERLPDPAAARERRAYWRERLDALRALLEA